MKINLSKKENIKPGTGDKQSFEIKDFDDLVFKNRITVPTGFGSDIISCS